ncbi:MULTISPECIES: hypothetical protein [Sorangium]|uniref:hypothetical protein n=1 Tax=Sorangium TaxID=39643 RepID=UPI003D9C60C7
MKNKEPGNKLGLMVCAGAALGLSTGCAIEGAPDEAQPPEIISGESAATITGGPADEVVLHDLSSFSGVSQGFGIGRYNVADLTIIGNDRASAISVPAGLRVTVFFNHNFEGQAHVLTSDTDLVALGADDIISSLVVARASDPQLDVVTFYEHANASGDSFVYSVGAALLFASPWTAWDRRISSVHLPPGFKVTLSEAWIGLGTQETLVLTADANLAPHNFDDRTRSFLIERL